MIENSGNEKCRCAENRGKGKTEEKLNHASSPGVSFQKTAHDDLLARENINFLVDSRGTRHVLKITTDQESSPELEEAVLDRLQQAGLPVPGSIPTRAGERILQTPFESRTALVRLQSFLPGRQLTAKRQMPCVKGPVQRIQKHKICVYIL